MISPRVIVRAIQPALWLLLFGEVFTKVHAISTGDVPYLDFMAPGILAQSVLFVAIFYGIAIIWERDMGIVHKFLASPTPRGALVLGKALSAGIRSLSQAVIIYLLAFSAGRKDELDCFGTHWCARYGDSRSGLVLRSLADHCFAGQDARTIYGHGPGAHNAAFLCQQRDLSDLHDAVWLQIISHANPLTYQVDALRALMLAHGTE